MPIPRSCLTRWLGTGLLLTTACTPRPCSGSHDPLEPTQSITAASSDSQAADLSSRSLYSALPKAALARGPRKPPIENEAVWETRYHHLDLAEIEGLVLRADELFRAERRKVAQRLFRDADQVLDLATFLKRDRDQGHLYAVRPQPQTGAAQFVCLSTTAHPHLYARQAEWRWLLERRVTLRRVQGVPNRLATPHSSRGQSGR